MPRPKPHLQDIHRGVATSHSRGGYLRLDMNECVEGVPEDFVREVLGSVEAKDLAAYPEYDRLVASLADAHELEASMVLPTDGSDAAIKYLFEAYVSPGDAVVFTNPTFAMYPVYAQIYQANCIQVPYHDDLSFPEHAFMEQLPGAAMAAVVNPNNPSGVVIGVDVLERLARRCEELDILLVVDEAYFHYSGISALPLLQHFENVVVLRTFSKAYGIASLRLGYILASRQVVEAVRRVKPTFDVNGLAVRFALALLSAPEILESHLELVEQGRNWLERRLRDKGIAFRRCNANFSLINLGRHVAAVKFNLAEQKVLVSGGFSHPGLESYLRVTLAGPEVMAQFWSAFERALAMLDTKI